MSVYCTSRGGTSPELNWTGNVLAASHINSETNLPALDDFFWAKDKG